MGPSSINPTSCVIFFLFFFLKLIIINLHLNSVTSVAFGQLINGYQELENLQI